MPSSQRDTCLDVVLSRAHERVLVLLALLGGQQHTILPPARSRGVKRVARPPPRPIVRTRRDRARHSEHARVARSPRHQRDSRQSWPAGGPNAARSCGTCAMRRPTSAAISRAPSTSATRYASCVTRQPRISSKPRASKRYSAVAESIRRARSSCIRPVATPAPISRISPSATSAARMSPSTTTASTAGQTTSARSKPARRGCASAAQACAEFGPCRLHGRENSDGDDSFG